MPDDSEFEVELSQQPAACRFSRMETVFVPLNRSQEFRGMYSCGRPPDRFRRCKAEIGVCLAFEEWTGHEALMSAE